MILFSVVVNLLWPLFQLDVKNIFVYRDLQEEVYTEQPPGYVAQGKNKVCPLKKAIYGLKQSLRVWFEKFGITIFGIDFHRCHSNHSVFVRHTKYGIVVLAVYVGDILLTSSDSAGLLETKEYLKRNFVTKDMERPKYFLGIEVAHKKHSVFLSQRKYALDLLEETWLLGCKFAGFKVSPVSVPRVGIGMTSTEPRSFHESAVLAKFMRLGQKSELTWPSQESTQIFGRVAPVNHQLARDLLREWAVYYLVIFTNGLAFKIQRENRAANNK